MTRWITLAADWKLQDVQAILTVVIAFLCAGGAFVLVRVFWTNAARRLIVKKQDIRTYDLLSLNNVGEVIDVLWLLRSNTFSLQYTKIIIQSACVIVLTITSLMSGLIARYSTRAEMISIPRNISGILAERTLQSARTGSTANETFHALKRANFPPDQLLDFLPDSNANWEYIPDQWTNSSWAMNCTYFEEEEILNVSVQNCSGSIIDEVPYLTHPLRDWPVLDWEYGWASSGFEHNKTQWKDIVIFLHASWGLRYATNEVFAPGECGCPAQEMFVRTFMFHINEAPRDDSDEHNCLFTHGHAKSLRYTGASCKLTRVAPPISKEELERFRTPGAAPDIVDVAGIASQCNLQLGSAAVRQSMQDVPVTLISGKDLALFYQSQLIGKDTELSSYHRVYRTINAFTPITQVSFICTVICCIGALLVLLGLVNYCFFVFYHWEDLSDAPQSKLDWLLLLIRREVAGDDKQFLISTSVVHARAGTHHDIPRNTTHKHARSWSSSKRNSAAISIDGPSGGVSPEVSSLISFRSDPSRHDRR